MQPWTPSCRASHLLLKRLPSCRQSAAPLRHRLQQSACKAADSGTPELMLKHCLAMQSTGSSVVTPGSMGNQTGNGAVEGYMYTTMMELGSGTLHPTTSAPSAIIIASLAPATTQLSPSAVMAEMQDGSTLATTVLQPYPDQGVFLIEVCLLLVLTMLSLKVRAFFQAPFICSLIA